MVCVIYITVREFECKNASGMRQDLRIDLSQVIFIRESQLWGGETVRRYFLRARAVRRQQSTTLSFIVMGCDVMFCGILVLYVRGCILCACCGLLVTPNKEVVLVTGSTTVGGAIEFG